jgi:hypothetical protein
LSYPLLPVPLGLLPGKYHLQMVVYSNYKQPWPTGQSEISLDLSEVEVTLPPPDYVPETETFETIAGHDFNGELRLADYN